ncbi:hypothetical protein [Ammoniphilus resinae]|uniref:Uncharacterized protein n=1 Tax=Ammoniphilus resinae TaxID=861532 RepID=A0ABS4GSQ8_9BACL|nr:hypothetical protein [Ammoniphilus resinae]MBP1933318.1 hypothetical protein [Ammoniphilus resinae]
MTQIEKQQELLRKADVLKQYEVYGYRIAYYVLKNETLATKAATQALLELFYNDDFFHLPPFTQKHITKKVFMKQSLITKASVIV